MTMLRYIIKICTNSQLTVKNHIHTQRIKEEKIPCTEHKLTKKERWLSVIYFNWHISFRLTFILSVYFLDCVFYFSIKFIWFKLVLLKVKFEEKTCLKSKTPLHKIFLLTLTQKKSKANLFFINSENSLSFSLFCRLFSVKNKTIFEFIVLEHIHTHTYTYKHSQHFTYITNRHYIHETHTQVHSNQYKIQTKYESTKQLQQKQHDVFCLWNEIKKLKRKKIW